MRFLVFACYRIILILLSHKSQYVVVLGLSWPRI